MSQNYLSNPKARVIAVAPRAKCVKDWTKGCYAVHFGQEVKDFNGKPIRSLITGSNNPADAWFSACAELRLS